MPKYWPGFRGRIEIREYAPFSRDMLASLARYRCFSSERLLATLGDDGLADAGCMLVDAQLV